MKLTQLTKWDNLFWSQPTSSDNTSISAIENNMTKNLLYILTNKYCNNIKNKFFKKLSLSSSKIKRKKCQLTISDINTYEDKPTYLIYLTKSKAKFNNDKNKRNGKRNKNIYDGYIEFEDYNLVFEVKVDSPNDNKQVERYVKELKRDLGKNYKGKIDFTWDDIHDVFMKSLNSKGIEKIFAEEYVKLMEVSGMVNKFYGFKGSTIAEHNHELRCLLDEIIDDKKYSFNTKSKSKVAWIPIWEINASDKKQNKCHYTIHRNNSELVFYVTLLWPSVKLQKYILEKEFQNLLKELESKNNQKKEGKILELHFADYKSIDKSQGGSHLPNLEVFYHFTKQKDTSSDLTNIFNLYDKKTNEMKQIQIGYKWSLNYHGTRADWENAEALNKIKKSFSDLERIYNLLSDVYDKSSKKSK